MNDKNRRLAIGVGAGILGICIILACLGGIAYRYQDDLKAILGLSPSKTIAEMLPEDTGLYVAFSPNIQSLPGYQNLKTLYLDNPEIQALCDEYESDINEGSDITYENDVKPWLGREVGMAVMNLAQTINDPSATPAVVVVAETNDQEASNNFINKVLTEAAAKDEPFTEEVYQDITLHLQKNQSTDELSVLTTFNNFVVFSSDEALVKSMIDITQDSNQPSLVNNQHFQKITAELPPESALTFYMNFSTFIDAALEESAFQLPSEQVNDLESFEAIGMASTLQPDGIKIDFVISYDLENMSERMKASLEQPSSPNAILNDIPADALFVYSLNNLNNVWQQAKAGFESNPDFAEGLADLEQELGISIDEDVFSWMTGEFALVLIKVTPTNDFIPPLGGYVLIGTHDVDEASSHVQNLVDSFGPGMPLEQQTIGDVEMNVFTDFNSEVQGGYGFYNNYFLLSYLEDSIIAATSASQNPLTNSDNFKTIQNHLPGENYGYVYADVDLGRQLVEDQLSDFEREDYNKNVRPFLEPIRAFGGAASTEGTDRGVSKGSFFFLITE